MVICESAQYMALTDKIIPLILAFNEEPNLRRTLSRLTWAKEVLVVDSFSTDATLDICRSFPNVRVLQRVFDTAAQQDNFGLANVGSEWVLSMDADYVLSDELLAEIKAMEDEPPFDGYFIPFRYCVFGKPLRSTILPPRCSLYRREKATYFDDGHTQRVRIDGRTGSLRHPYLHDDRKSLSRWLKSQDRYTEREVEKLLRTPHAELGLNDRLRTMKWVAPPLVFFYTLFVRGNVLDGWHGWYYALQRTLAESLLSLRLTEVQRLQASVSDSGDDASNATSRFVNPT